MRTYFRIVSTFNEYVKEKTSSLAKIRIFKTRSAIGLQETFAKLNLESIRRCSEPALSEAERDKLISHFRDNAGQQVSGSGAGIGEIRISNLARLA